jgi:hypothetical protein
MSANVLVFGRRQRREARQTELAGVQKAPRHEVAGSWALAGSECYGDLMLAPISMMGGTPARRDVHVRMQVSPGECNGRLGGHTEFVNGRLAD